MKLSASGAAGALCSGFVPGNALAKITSSGSLENVWRKGMRINPEISNLRAVLCHDPEMIPSTPVVWSTLANQNSGVNHQKVTENMDRMAIALSQKPTASEAWGAIFQKPPHKTWSQVKAAMKVNCLEPNNRPRMSVVGRVCQSLIDLGVLPENITIYDMLNAGVYDYSGPDAAGIVPQGVSSRVGRTRRESLTLEQRAQYHWITDENIWEEDLIDFPGLASPQPVARPLNDGSTDILINISVNKGHTIKYAGQYTLTMKNHYGSVKYYHADGDAIMREISAINQSAQILGPGLPVRQQLCIVDALWSMSEGPNGRPTDPTGALAMATFSPVLDYLVVRRIRENPAFMNIYNPWYKTYNEAVNYYLSSFGFDPDSEQIRNLNFVDALTYNPSLSVGRSGSSARYSIHISMYGSAEPQSVAFSSVPFDRQSRLEVIDAKGRVMRVLTPSDGRQDNISIHWDGRDQNGNGILPGIYHIRLICGNLQQVRQVALR